jgi:putative ABC transport system permease protein
MLRIRTLVYLWIRALGENIRFAGTAIISHKLRTALTTLGIVIGVATVISMVSLVEGFNNSVVASFESFGATLVQFQKFEPRFGPGGPDDAERARKNLTYEDAVAIKELAPSMLAVSPELYWFAGTGPDGDFGGETPVVKYGSVEANPDTIAGVIADYALANNHFVSEGRFINDLDHRHSSAVTVVGASIAETLFPNVDPLGKKVLLAGRRYTVIGVMEKQGKTMFESTDQHVYLPFSTFDQHFPWVRRTRSVNIATIPRSPELVEKATEEGVAVLRTRRKVPFNKPNDFAIMTPEKMIGNFRSITSGITLAMIFIASIALLVGGVGVMNIMLVSVTERTREIGVRKAMGALKSDIVVQFLTEAMTLSAIGGVIGVLVGLLIAFIVRNATPLAASTPLWTIIVGLAVSISIGLFFGIYPAWRAAKLDPIEALRYE